MGNLTVKQVANAIADRANGSYQSCCQAYAKAQKNKVARIAIKTFQIICLAAASALTQLCANRISIKIGGFLGMIAAAALSLTASNFIGQLSGKVLNGALI